MEFLVRLEDKINIQVFCLNPIHKGKHMDRVFYKDDTFVAPCPECGNSEYLYRKNNAITKKGHFITFKPDGWSWGTNERKHYGIVRIDCTKEQAREWCEGIRNEEKIIKARDYQEQADVRKQVIIEPIIDSILTPITEAEKEALRSAIREALESDTMYLTLTWDQRQAENRAQIDYRPRILSFDFEKVLSVNELKNWNDEDDYSKVIEKPTVSMETI